MVGNKSSWEERDYYPDERAQKALVREFTFTDFAQALVFVNEVAVLAEQAVHHPDINLSWGFVRIWLTTHSQHAVTDKDYDLAAAIDQLDGASVE